MLQTKEITKKFSDLPQVKALYRTVFPRQEQMPFWFLLRKAKQDGVRFTAFYDGGEFVGLAYTNTYEDLTFLLYLAVCPAVQSKGYGSQILTWLHETYPSNRFLLNMEALDEGAGNYAQRQSRRKFYEKNGYRATGLHVKDFHVIYELLIRGGGCTAAEYTALYRQFAGAVLYPFIKQKLIEEHWDC
ncbi:MAG: GNAT family N-acetyltransferase [Clostridiales bacterium]|nr:GNAT family N-acetyltransferase [Clostridiales bacterium]